MQQKSHPAPKHSMTRFDFVSKTETPRDSDDTEKKLSALTLSPQSPPSSELQRSMLNRPTKQNTQWAQEAATEQKCLWVDPTKSYWKINKSPNHDFDIFIPPRALRVRDQLCAHQQPNTICNEVRCSRKVEECKSERKVTFFNLWCEEKSLGWWC